MRGQTPAPSPALPRFGSLGQKTSPPIDLPQPPLAVLIVGVFAAIAVAGGPRHHFRDGGAFAGEQKLELVFEAPQPARRDVVLERRPGLVGSRSSGEPFLHCRSRDQAGTYVNRMKSSAMNSLEIR